MFNFCQPGQFVYKYVCVFLKHQCLVFPFKYFSLVCFNFLKNKDLNYLFKMSVWSDDDSTNYSVPSDEVLSDSCADDLMLMVDSDNDDDDDVGGLNATCNSGASNPMQVQPIEQQHLHGGTTVVPFWNEASHFQNINMEHPDQEIEIDDENWNVRD